MATNSSQSKKNGESGDDDSDGILAPTVTTSPRVHQVNSLRGGDWQTDLSGIDNLRDELWMTQYGGERNLFKALGYIKDPDYRHYRSRYERTDTARALIDKLPKKAWETPAVVDVGSEEGTSEFEETVNEFLEGQYTEEKPAKVFERASRMERLGQFSLVFIGFNDAAASPEENEEEDASDLLSNEVDDGSLENTDPEEAISYIETYDQGRIDEDEIDYETDDPTKERFGKPIRYEVDLGDNRPTAHIHWTRLIHVVGNVYDNSLKSPSVLKQSLNRVDDIEKILGGSAEGYWRSAYQGMVISPPEISGGMGEFSDTGEDLHAQINRYINNFSREIFTQANIDPIDVTAQSPMDFVEAQYRDLAAGHDIPQSILMGNETGERATEQDLKMWHERVGEFRSEYNEPVMLRPFIDRCIRFGVFPEPEGGPGGYRFSWPALDEQTEQEEWDVKQTKAGTIQTGTGGNPQSVTTPQEFRQEVLGWKPDIGGEVSTEDLEAMESAESADLQIDESDERVQEQFGRENVEDVAERVSFRLNEIDRSEIERITDKDDPSDEEVDKLRVKTEDGYRGFIVDILTQGFDVEEESVEASEDEPKYVVITESDNKPHGYYTEDEIQQEKWDAGIEDPIEDLAGEEDRENVLKREILNALPFARSHQEGHFEWPESWKESEKPARLIAMDAWLSMGARHGGGSPGGCTSTMRGHIVSPDRFCADFKDRIYQWEYWRGDSWAPGD